RDGLVVTLLVNEDHAERVPGLAKILALGERGARVLLGFAQTAFVGRGSTEPEVDEGGEVLRVRVLVVELDGQLGVLEGSTRITAQEELAREVEFRLGLTLWARGARAPR